MKIDRNKDTSISKEILISKQNQTEKNDKPQDSDKLSLNEYEKKAVSILEKKGIEVNSKTINIVKNYLALSDAPIEEKLENLEIALEKDIAINEKTLNNLNITKTVSLLDFLKDISIIKDNKLKAGTEVIKRNKNLDIKTDKALKEITKIVELENEKSSKTIKTTKNNINGQSKTMQKEKMQDIKTYEKHENTSEKEKKGLSQKINEFLRDNTIDTLERLASLINQDYLLDTKSNLDKRVLLERKITPKIRSIINDFKDFKADIQKQMTRVESNNQAMSQKEKISSMYNLIEKIDNTIMKSEISAYMSVLQEKKMLEISSKLNLAKDFFENSKPLQAEKILKEQIKELRNMKFDPSLKKVIVMVESLSSIDKKSNIKNLSSEFLNMSLDPTNENISANKLVNYLRIAGENHEVEKFQSFTEGKNESKTDFRIPVNLKEKIIEISKSKDSKEAKDAMKILQFLNKKSMLKKLGKNSNEHSVNLSIPIKLGTKIESLHININSPDKNILLDWENFNIFFMISSETLGDLGISLTALDKKINLEILNDEIKKRGENIEFENSLKSDFKKNIEYLGFLLNKIMFRKLDKTSKDKQENKNKEKTHSKDSTKVIDIKI